MDPTTSARPPIPLMVIMTAANTVSRASEALLPPPEAMSVTISATSITVTATASTREPNGSPTRWATTSAWWTAARTAPASTSATSATTSGGSSRPQVNTSRTRPRIGTDVVHELSVVVQKSRIQADPTDAPGRRSSARRDDALPVVPVEQQPPVLADGEGDDVPLGLTGVVGPPELDVDERGRRTVLRLDVARLHRSEVVPEPGEPLVGELVLEVGAGQLVRGFE